MYVGVGGGHIYEDVLIPPDLCEKLPFSGTKKCGNHREGFSNPPFDLQLVPSPYRRRTEEKRRRRSKRFFPLFPVKGNYTSLNETASSFDALTSKKGAGRVGWPGGVLFFIKIKVTQLKMRMGRDAGVFLPVLLLLLLLTTAAAEEEEESKVEEEDERDLFSPEAGEGEYRGGQENGGGNSGNTSPAEVAGGGNNGTDLVDYDANGAVNGTYDDGTYDSDYYDGKLSAYVFYEKSKDKTFQGTDSNGTYNGTNSANGTFNGDNGTVTATSTTARPWWRPADSTPMSRIRGSPGSGRRRKQKKSNSLIAIEWEACCFTCSPRP